MFSIFRGFFCLILLSMTVVGNAGIMQTTDPVPTPTITPEATPTPGTLSEDQNLDLDNYESKVTDGENYLKNIKNGLVGTDSAYEKRLTQLNPEKAQSTLLNITYLSLMTISYIGTLIPSHCIGQSEVIESVVLFYVTSLAYIVQESVFHHSYATINKTMTTFLSEQTKKKVTYDEQLQNLRLYRDMLLETLLINLHKIRILASLSTGHSLAYSKSMAELSNLSSSYTDMTTARGDLQATYDALQAVKKEVSGNSYLAPLTSSIEMVNAVGQKILGIKIPEPPTGTNVENTETTQSSPKWIDKVAENLIDQQKQAQENSDAFSKQVPDVKNKIAEGLKKDPPDEDAKKAEKILPNLQASMTKLNDAIQQYNQNVIAVAHNSHQSLLTCSSFAKDADLIGITLDQSESFTSLDSKEMKKDLMKEAKNSRLTLRRYLSSFGIATEEHNLIANKKLEELKIHANKNLFHPKTRSLLFNYASLMALETMRQTQDKSYFLMQRIIKTQGIIDQLKKTGAITKDSEGSIRKQVSLKWPCLTDISDVDADCKCLNATTDVQPTTVTAIVTPTPTPTATPELQLSCFKVSRATLSHFGEIDLVMKGYADKMEAKSTYGNTGTSTVLANLKKVVNRNRINSDDISGILDLMIELINDLSSGKVEEAVGISYKITALLSINKQFREKVRGKNKRPSRKEMLLSQLFLDDKEMSDFINGIVGDDLKLSDLLPPAIELAPTVPDIPSVAITPDSSPVGTRPATSTGTN